MSLKKIFVGATASAFVATAALIGLPGSAQAAPSIEVSPNADLKGGDEITVTGTGFPAGQSIAVGICQKGRPSEGPGDCAAAKEGHSLLAVSDDQGNIDATLIVVEGPAGNTADPAYDCGPNDPCVVAVSAIGGEEARAEVDLNYAAAAADTNDDAAEETEAAATTGSDDTIAETGPRETLMIALVGFALFQIGLVFAVRGARASRQSAV